MVLLGTIANSPYSRLLITSGSLPVPFEFAPYPPVATRLFTLGSVYSIAGNGEIDLVDNVPPIYENERPIYVVTEEQNLDRPLLANVAKVGAISFNRYQETDLTSYGIYTPFSPQPNSGDTTLDIYLAGGNTEAAFLMPGPSCLRSYFRSAFFDNSTWWQMVKHLRFETSRGQIYIVTDILFTNRWACEYRTNQHPGCAYYAVNHKDGPYHTAFSDLQLRHGSLSNSVRTAQLNDTEPYTVFASRQLVDRRNIGSSGNWLVPFKNAFTTLGKVFSFKKDRLPNTGFTQELTPYTSGTQVTRLHLGSTIYLLEIQEYGTIAYALESEGHEEGYSLDALISTLEWYAKYYGTSDCSHHFQ